VSKTIIKPQNLPEALIWYYLIYTYPIYLLGAQYLFATLLANFLVFYLLRTWWNQIDEAPLPQRIIISPSVWVWIIAILVIEVALIVGHLNFNLGLSQIIKSTLNWYRSWALLALFPLAGHLNIRPQIIYRAVCILCLQSFIMVLICSAASMLHVPQIYYVSPLKVFGGGPLPSSVLLPYGLDMGQVRLLLFTPWPPALGIVGNIYFFLSSQDADKKWRWIGMVGAVAMAVGSVSRLAIVCLPTVIILVWFLTNCFYPWVQFTTGFFSLVIGMFLPTLINLLKTVKAQFNSARSGSSEVRAMIQKIARYRWWNEAPIWGHGIMHPGPAVTANMPIGSHHTWFGTLFVHGLVGSVALAIALLWSLIDLLIKAQFYETAKVGLSIILVIIMFTFAETLDSLSYLCWPGLLMLGIAFKENLSTALQTNS
jgi:hypothetical protein